MTNTDKLLHARDGKRQVCKWCQCEIADDNDLDIIGDGSNLGGDGAWLCWDDDGFCFANDSETQRLRAEYAEAQLAEVTLSRYELIKKCQQAEHTATLAKERADLLQAKLAAAEAKR